MALKSVHFGVAETHDIP